MVKNDQLYYLFDRYIQKKCTPEEKQQFFGLLMDPAQEKRLREISEAYTASVSEGRLMDGETSDMVWKAIQQEAGIKESPVLPIRLAWKKWTAAAIILMLTGSAVWLASQQSAPGILIAENPVNNISPGTIGAILTLSNGNTIILDSLQNGIIANQNGTNVFLKAGQLSYQPFEKGNVLEGGEGKTLYNTMTTPRGNQYKLILADGTKVWLNAASSLKYPASFLGQERRVEVTGEAYFEVSPDREKPFLVKINDQAEVEVLGTSFNINAYKDEPVIRTSLLTGSVKVRAGRASAEAGYILLHPEEECVLQENAARVNKNADLETAVAWTHGMFRFRSADLRMVMRQISRWYDVDIQYAENVDARFSGSMYRSENINELLKIIEFTSKVKFSVNQNTITVSSK